MVKKYQEYTSLAPAESYDQAKAMLWKNYMATTMTAWEKYRNTSTALAEWFAKDPKRRVKKYLLQLRDVRREYIVLAAKAFDEYIGNLTTAWAKHSLQRIGITMSKFDWPKEIKRKSAKGKRAKHAKQAKQVRKVPQTTREE